MNWEALDPNVVIPSVIAAYAAIRASKAERNSRPVSNGFAGEVKTSLKALEAHLEDVHKDIREVRGSITTHLQNHP
jgi:hypothetical protein